MLFNMKDLLAVARAHAFAVPAFNISSNMLLKGVMEAVEEKQAPVILAIHPTELSFVGTSFVKAALDEAIKATVPVCIHLDHGSSIAEIMQAIQCGFTSVMIDASHLPLAENIAACQKVVEIAHAINISVEGELGTIGSTGADAEAGADEITYTNPDDVAIFVEATQVDTLAVAIGISAMMSVNLSIVNDSILWSLVAELIYYTLYPALLIVRRRTLTWSPMIFGAFALGLVLASTNPTAGNYPSFGNALNWILGLPCWLSGCWLADAVVKNKIPESMSFRSIWIWRGLILVLAMVCSILRFHTPLVVSQLIIDG